MKRRFNYTGRKKIPRENVSITLIRYSDGKSRGFSVSLNLNGLNLLADAKVYVETYHRNEMKRFDYGTAGNFSPPQDTTLTGLAYTENLKFRVLVVDESGIHGKILAHADRITPEASADKKSILEVDFRDLGQQIWKVEFTGDGGAPVLVINDRIPNITNIAKSAPRFIMDVYPSALREVFIHMIFIEGLDSLSDPPVEWHKYWLEFAKVVCPENPPQEIYKSGENNDRIVKKDWLEWIDRVVEEFCWRRTEWREYILIVGEGEE
jgi:hypothetical protein